MMAAVLLVAWTLAVVFGYALLFALAPEAAGALLLVFMVLAIAPECIASWRRRRSREH